MSSELPRGRRVPLVGKWNETERLLHTCWRNVVNALLKFRASELEEGAQYYIDTETENKSEFFGKDYDVPVCNIDREFQSGCLDHYVVCVKGVDGKQHNISGGEIRKVVCTLSEGLMDFYFLVVYVVQREWK